MTVSDDYYYLLFYYYYQYFKFYLKSIDRSDAAAVAVLYCIVQYYIMECDIGNTTEEFYVFFSLT